VLDILVIGAVQESSRSSRDAGRKSGVRRHITVTLLNKTGPQHGTLSPRSFALFSARIGGILKQARQQLNMSRDELARRGGVSTRLVAEFERGQRPNVSLTTALELLNLVGVSVVFQAPTGAKVESRGAPTADLERAARAAYRRKTWKGRQVHLHHQDDEPLPPRTTSERLAAVTQLSTQAFLIAAVGRGRKASNSKRPVSR
jgi:transcriptional regulator with XRE-family HTH domain